MTKMMCHVMSEVVGCCRVMTKMMCHVMSEVVG